MSVYDLNMSQAQFADAVGSQALAVSSTAVSLTVPTGANGRSVQVLSNTVRVRLMAELRRRQLVWRLWTRMSSTCMVTAT